MNYDKIFAERLAQERKNKKLSTRGLGELAGVSSSLINAVENSRSTMSVENAMNIALALDTTVEYLLGQEEYLKKKTMNKDMINTGDVSAFEKMILHTYKFPNGMTYTEMDEKMKEMKELEIKMEKIASTIFGEDVKENNKDVEK